MGCSRKRKSAASAAPQSSERGPGRPPKRQKAELSRTKSNQQVQGHGEDEAEAQTEAQEAEVEREEASTEDDVQQEGSMDRDEEGDAAETNAAVESSYDLFGQRRTWQRAMKAAADLRKTAKDYELKLKTTQGKTLRKHIARVAKLYDGLEDDSKEVIEAKNKSLQEPVNLLQSSLAILDINQSSHFRDTFRDMHTHVIPGLVELIDLIITARTAGWKEELYPSELEEVISFLGRLYSLCDHLSGFTDVKATEAPVVKPVKQTILPAIRAIHKHLVNERNRQKRAAQYSEQKMAEDRKRRHEGEESARAAHRKEIQKKRLATFQSLEKALLEDQAFQMPVQEAPPLKKARIEWTEEEDDELIMRLVEWSNEPSKLQLRILYECAFLC